MSGTSFRPAINDFHYCEKLSAAVLLNVMAAKAASHANLH